MKRKIYSWELSYEDIAIEKSDITFKLLSGSLYEIIRDNCYNVPGVMCIDREVKDLFNDSNKKVSIIIQNRIYANFNICQKESQSYQFTERNFTITCNQCGVSKIFNNGFNDNEIDNDKIGLNGFQHITIWCDSCKNRIDEEA